MPRFIITGGLGTGKTSTLSALGPDLVTVAEPARDLIAEHRAATGESGLDARPELFLERLISRSFHQYCSVSDSDSAVFDRALPDCIAYAAVFNLNPGPAVEAASENRYDNPVFVATPWKAIYRTDDMRLASFKQAEAFYAEVVSAYTQLGYQLIELPQVSALERASFVRNHIP